MRLQNGPWLLEPLADAEGEHLLRLGVVGLELAGMQQGRAVFAQLAGAHGVAVVVVSA